MLVLIDNYDSFTWNLAHRLGELGAAVKVVRNDALSVDDVEALAPDRLVISPGPGEITSRSGASASRSSTLRASFRTTFTAAPSSPSRCARFHVNES